jgi:hypothetical protein
MRWRITLVLLCVLMQCVAFRTEAQAAKPAAPGKAPAAEPAPPAPKAAMPPEAPSAPEAPMHQLVYNVSELIRVAEDYPLQPAMIPSTRLPGAVDMQGLYGGGGNPPQQGDNDSQKHPATTVEAIAQLVRETVMPDSWAETGGRGTIKTFGRSLIISNTDEAHKQIQSLLQQLQTEAAPTRMVAVRAYWLLLEPKDLPTLGDKAKAEHKSAAMLEVPGELINEKTIYSQGQTLCFNGQTVHISSGRGRTVVTGATPVVGQSSVGYSFSTEVVQNGVAMQVKPDVTPDGKSAVLDLQSIVSELPEAKPATQPVDPMAAPGEMPAQQRNPSPESAFHALDRVNVIAQQFRTTVRIPLDKKILIGGMTMEPNIAGGSSRNLYLVVEVNAGD